MPEHIFESLAADWHHAEHSAADRMRHLMGIGHHPAQPATCGQCQDGVIPVDQCTCGGGLHPYGHEPGCGYEPCPNGCWDVLHPDTENPATRPVNLATAAAAAPAKEHTMSLVTDVEQGYQAVKNELGRFDQALPGLLERARAFEASPFAAIAEKAVSAVLPPEAVAIAVKAADTVINDLVALYAAPAPAEPAPAPAQ